MARYRVNDKVYLNDSFTLISTQGDPHGNGVMVDIPVNPAKAALFCCTVDAGSVVEISDDVIPGPAFEAMDDKARAQAEKYPAAYRPEFHNTLDALPKTHVPDGLQAARDSADIKATVGELTKAVAALVSAQAAQMGGGEPPRLKLGGK